MKSVTVTNSLAAKWDLIDIPGSEYIQCFLLIWVTETIKIKNPLDNTLLPLGNFSNLHKTKMAANILLNIL